MDVSREYLKGQVVTYKTRIPYDFISNGKTITGYKNHYENYDLYDELVRLNNHYIDIARKTFKCADIPYPTVIVRPIKDLAYNKENNIISPFLMASASANSFHWTVEYNLESLLNKRNHESACTNYLGFGINQTFNTFVPHEIAHLIANRYCDENPLTPHGNKWKNIMQLFRPSDNPNKWLDYPQE